MALVLRLDEFTVFMMMLEKFGMIFQSEREVNTRGKSDC